MRVDKKKRVLFWLTFAVCIVAIGFLIAAMASEFWIDAYPVRLVDDDVLNATWGELGTKFKGHIYFGLFNGYKKLDHGLGVREGSLAIECDASENKCTMASNNQRPVDLDPDTPAEEGFNFGLWLSTVIFICVGIAWGLVSMAFAVLNASIKPIETITGPMGLYLWNILASSFCLLAVIMYVILYYVDLKENVLSVEDQEVYLWTSKDLADLDYSFYFVVVSAVLYASNVVIIALSGVECTSVRFGHNINEKSMDGVMMY